MHKLQQSIRHHFRIIQAILIIVLALSLITEVYYYRSQLANLIAWPTLSFLVIILFIVIAWFKFPIFRRMVGEEKRTKKRPRFYWIVIVCLAIIFMFPLSIYVIQSLANQSLQVYILLAASGIFWVVCFSFGVIFHNIPSESRNEFLNISRKYLIATVSFAIFLPLLNLLNQPAFANIDIYSKPNFFNVMALTRGVAFYAACLLFYGGEFLILFGIVDLIHTITNLNVSNNDKILTSTVQLPTREAQHLKTPAIGNNSNITPREIYKTVSKLPPFQQGQAAKNYIGLEIYWSVEFLSINSTTAKEKFDVTAYGSKYMIPIILFTIDIEKYTQFKIMNHGEKFFVSGKIISVDNGIIKLDDCTLGFPVKTDDITSNNKPDILTSENIDHLLKDAAATIKSTQEFGSPAGVSEKDEPIEGISGELPKLLKEIDPNLELKRQGSWQTFYGNGNDRRSQSAHSMREVMNQLLDFLAPEDKVIKAGWYKKPKDTAPVTRKMKVRFAIAGDGIDISDSAVNLTDSLAEVVDKTYYKLSAEAHTSGVCGIIKGDQI
jgi:hypothetical protein